MNFFLILASIAILSCAAVASIREGNRKLCIEKIGVAEAEVDAAAVSQYVNASPQIQCYIECMLQRMGAIKNGEVDVASVNKFLHWKKMNSDDAAAALNKCLPKMDGTECTGAYNFKLCLNEIIKSRT